MTTFNNLNRNYMPEMVKYETDRNFFKPKNLKQYEHAGEMVVVVSPKDNMDFKIMEYLFNDWYYNHPEIESYADYWFKLKRANCQVHHINMDHNDNRPENLKWLTFEEHLAEHNKPKNEWFEEEVK